jgi:hypothetical protein
MEVHYLQSLGACTMTVFVAVAAVAATADKVSSPQQACKVLQHAAVTLHLSTHDHSGYYYCDSLGDTSEYYLLGLRVRDPQRARGEIYSNLVGWFAVRRVDGVVLDWDINENQAKPLTPLPRFEK